MRTDFLLKRCHFDEGEISLRMGTLIGKIKHMRNDFFQRCHFDEGEIFFRMGTQIELIRQIRTDLFQKHFVISTK